MQLLVVSAPKSRELEKHSCIHGTCINIINQLSFKKINTLKKKALFEIQSEVTVQVKIQLLNSFGNKTTKLLPV